MPKTRRQYRGGRTRASNRPSTRASSQASASTSGGQTSGAQIPDPTPITMERSSSLPLDANEMDQFLQIIRAHVRAEMQAGSPSVSTPAGPSSTTQPPTTTSTAPVVTNPTQPLGQAIQPQSACRVQFTQPGNLPGSKLLAIVILFRRVEKDILTAWCHRQV